MEFCIAAEGKLDGGGGGDGVGHKGVATEKRIKFIFDHRISFHLTRFISSSHHSNLLSVDVDAVQ